MSEDYEYRVVGATVNGWRRCDWKNWEGMLDDLEIVQSEDWPMVGIERRVPGDDKTIQRKPTPESEEWVDVTTEMTHFADEDVMEA